MICCSFRTTLSASAKSTALFCSGLHPRQHYNVTSCHREGTKPTHYLPRAGYRYFHGTDRIALKKCFAIRYQISIPKGVNLINFSEPNNVGDRLSSVTRRRGMQEKPYVTPKEEMKSGFILSGLMPTACEATYAKRTLLQRPATRRI